MDTLLNIYLVIVAYIASTAFLNRTDALYAYFDKLAYNANEQGNRVLKRLIERGAESKLLWCGACQTFWLSLLLLSTCNSLLESFLIAITVFSFIKLKPTIDGL